MRVCKGCGLPEHRKIDDRGREVVNLCPITNLCIPCLVKAKIPKPIDPDPFDGRKAAAGRDE